MNYSWGLRKYIVEYPIDYPSLLIQSRYIFVISGRGVFHVDFLSRRLDVFHRPGIRWALYTPIPCVCSLADVLTLYSAFPFFSWYHGLIGHIRENLRVPDISYFLTGKPCYYIFPLSSSCLIAFCIIFLAAMSCYKTISACVYTYFSKTQISNSCAFVPAYLRFSLIT